MTANGLDEPPLGQVATQPAVAGMTRAQKIWRRTWVGGSLALATASLLMLAAKPEYAILVPIAGLLLAVGALREVRAMGAAGHSMLPDAALFALPIVLLISWSLGDSFWISGGLSDWERLAPLTTRLAVMVSAGLVIGFVARYRASYSAPRIHPLGPMGLYVWIVFPLIGLGWVRFIYGISGLVALILLSKIGDVAGYYVGSAIGKRHPFPKLSPGKTVAGCVGSFIVGAIAGVLCQSGGMLPEPRFGWASGLLLGAAINLASQAGDLLESLLKRRGGVKDSGVLFGPSGGVLDVVDSLLLSVPVAIVVFPLTYVL
ncbi:MAG: phosphatidate cytidylyltransferase [Planctomycetota bacterium]|jgi:phosphatidate cytidylyltransferase